MRPAALLRVRSAATGVASSAVTAAAVAAAAAVTCGLAAGPAAAAPARPPAARPATAARGAARPSAGAPWRVELTVTGSGSPAFTAVTATGPAGAWAFGTAGGNAPTAYRLSGGAWSRRAFPAPRGDVVLAASASSGRNVWAFTLAGRALRFNGTSWRLMRAFRRPIGSGLAISRDDVWVFGAPGGPALGTWHYNGHRWARSASGRGLHGASALGPRDVWAFGATVIAHWNGRTWTRTSVARLLPRNTLLSHSFVAGICALSRRNVYAVASGGRQDEGGPLVLLHYNGARWRRLGLVNALGGPVAVVPDGRGGLWIPVMTGSPGSGSMVHYGRGGLRRVALPVTPARLALLGAAAHGTMALAVGDIRVNLTTGATRAVILGTGP